MNLIMFNAWIFESSLSAVFATLSKNVSDLFRRRGSLEMGSALKMAMIVGGIPADLLKIVLKFSVVILFKA